MAERRPGFLQRHDLGVLVVALAILAGGALLHRSLAIPKLVTFMQRGLQFERPGGWLSAPAAKPSVSPLLQGTAGFGIEPIAPLERGSDSALHLIFVSPADARQRIEVRIEERPSYRNLRGALAVQRLGQYGEFYWARSSGNAAIDRHDWLRTEFRYAFKASKGGSPQIAEAVEYATVNDGRLYVVTLHDRPENLQRFERFISGTLRVSSPQNNPQIIETRSQ